MLTSDYQIHHPLDERDVSELDKVAAATQRESARRAATLIAVANATGLAALIWLIS